MGIKDFSEDEFKVKFRIHKKHAKDVMTALATNWASANSNR